MKGNEVLLNNKQKGFEQGTIKTLLTLAEEVEEMRKTIREMGGAFTDLVRVQTMLNGVADGLENKIKMIMDGREGGGPTREGLS